MQVTSSLVSVESWAFKNLISAHQLAEVLSIPTLVVDWHDQQTLVLFYHGVWRKICHAPTWKSHTLTSWNFEKMCLKIDMFHHCNTVCVCIYIYIYIGSHPEIRTANRTVWWSSLCRFPSLPLLIVIVDLGHIVTGLPHGRDCRVRPKKTGKLRILILPLMWRVAKPGFETKSTSNHPWLVVWTEPCAS